jgi:gluconolactonase
MKPTLVLFWALIAAAFSTTPPPATAPQKPALGSIVRLDPAFDELVPKDAQLEKVAGGFTFTEGPLWRPSGVLWFSDVIGNVVRQWSPDGRVTQVLNPAGYGGKGNLPPGGYNVPTA